MIIVLIIISIIIIAIGLIIVDSDDGITTLVGIAAFLIKIVALVYLLAKIIGLRVIDEKIELYQTQNEEIEHKVEVGKLNDKIDYLEKENTQ